MKRSLKINGYWLEHEEELMKRLHNIIVGKQKGMPERKEAGYKWQLDSSNDWKAEIENGELIIACRYDYQESMLDVLVNFCEEWL